MATAFRIAKFIVVAFACYIVFGIAGQFSALGILRLTGNNDALGWAMYGLAILVALSVPAWVWARQRSGAALSPFARVFLAGFTAFFCLQWTAAGTPDWSPLPLVIGFLVCTASAVLVLHFGRPLTTVERAVEQGHRAERQKVDC